MDTLMNQLARELSDAIAAAVTDDSRVEACREKARAAGIEMRVSLEAVIAFVNRAQPVAGTPVRKTGSKKGSGRQQDMTANDRRFLKSLRISADEPAEKEVE
jgi:phage I-like protein